VPPEASLPRRRKLLYASSSLGGEALTQSRSQWLLYFYAPPRTSDLERLLPRELAGPLLTVGRLLQAFEDPLVGWWSDRTRSRLGRRLPFILGATPFWALFAFLLFTPPDAGTVATAFYLVVTLELMFLFGTLSGGPYESLLPEIARTSDDRVSIVGMRVYFGAAGAAAGFFGAGLLIDHAGFAAMAAVMALLALVFRYAGTAGVWEQARSSRAAADIPLRDALRATFANDQFRFFLPSFVLFQLGLQMVLAVLPFYAEAVLGAEETGTWVGALTAVAIAVMVLTIRPLARFAHRTSKRHAFRLAMAGSALVFPLLSVAGLIPGVPAEAEVVAVMVLAGPPIAGVYLFPAALTADIVDYDASRTGLRREAMYYGAQNFVEKLSTSLGPAILAGLLLLGDSAENTLGLRLVGPVAGAVVFVGFLIFRRYDLPDHSSSSASVGA
jgi:GPH family glycoside/pentoside/hexuronide:cation symporter